MSEKSTSSSCFVLKSSNSWEKDGSGGGSCRSDSSTFTFTLSSSFTAYAIFYCFGFLLYCRGGLCSTEDCGLSLDKVGVSSYGKPSVFFFSAASSFPSRAYLLSLKYSSSNSTVLLKT
jgi:hypothetical protein